MENDLCFNNKNGFYIFYHMGCPFLCLTIFTFHSIIAYWPFTNNESNLPITRNIASDSDTMERFESIEIWWRLCSFDVCNINCYILSFFQAIVWNNSIILDIPFSFPYCNQSLILVYTIHDSNSIMFFQSNQLSEGNRVFLILLVATLCFRKSIQFNLIQSNLIHRFYLSFDITIPIFRTLYNIPT